MAINAPPEDRTIALSVIEWQSALADEQEKAVQKARNYHAGNQPVFITERARQYLDPNDEGATFRMNVCRVVVEAVAERLIVEGFDSDEKALKVWAEGLWKAARLDAVSGDVHEMALRDGESFGFVYWDSDEERLAVIAHPRFVDKTNGGDGFGCIMFYPDDDPSQKPLRAVKRWSEVMPGEGEFTTTLRQRATIYYPERIEKVALDGSQWVRTTDEPGEPWPLPWLDADGDPLGIPITHFKNKDMRSEAWDALPMQDALNKTMVDLLASADLTSFRIFVALGFIPTTDGKAPEKDGSNALAIAPGQMIGTTAAAGDADFKAVDGEDPTPMLNMVKDVVLLLAMVTNTPISRFQVTGQVAAEGTLKQQESPLLSKVTSRSVVFGDAWEDLLNTARRIQNRFGVEVGQDAAPDGDLYTRWVNPNTRSDAEQQAELKLKKDLGIPRRQLWSELGYTTAQIDDMLADPEVQNATFARYPGFTAPQNGRTSPAAADSNNPSGGGSNQGADTGTDGAPA